MRLTRTLPALVLVLTPALAACSDGDPGPGASADASVSAPATDEDLGDLDLPTEAPADEPGDEPTDEPADEPAGDSDGQRVETDLVGFDVPTDWEVVDPEEFTGDQDGSDIEGDPAGGELTDRLGISGDQLLQMMSQADVIVLSGAGSVGGFIDNLNVVHYPGTLPTTGDLQEQLAAQYEALGADTPAITTVTTAAGEAVLVEYVLPLQGNQVQGRAIAVQSGDDVVSVTVSTLDAALATEVIDQVVASLDIAG